MNKLKFLFFYITIFLFNFNIVFANQYSDISLSGNLRVSKETVIGIIDFKKNQNYSLDDINLFQKKLFETNFFKDIKINLTDNNIEIIVIENPIIDFFYIEGVKNKSREEFFYDNLLLGQNKIFSENLLNQDIELIKSVFQQSGYFDTIVTPKISKTNNQNINLVLAVNRGEKFKVNEIFFTGEKTFSNSVLNDVISSSIHGWWKFLSQSTLVSESRLEYDKKLLKDFYLSEGYYDVQISSANIEFVENKNLANLYFSINSGPKYSFAEYSLQDNSSILNKKNKEDIKAIIDKKIINHYSLDILNDYKIKIYEYLNRNKIEFVKFDIVEEKNKSNGILLNFVFQQSKKSFIDLINVKGNSITNENVIRRELVFAEGDSFANYKLEESKKNLENTRIFKSIDTKIINKSNELVDVEINVVEQPTGSISAGIGAGTAGASVSTNLNEKNLFGMGISANTNLAIGTEKISGNVRFGIPDFKNSGNDFFYNFYILDTDYSNSGYESTVVGNSASLNYDLFEDISLNVGVGFDRDSIDTNSNASSLYKSREGSYMTYKTFYSVQNDKRDRVFQPTKGHRIGFGQTLGLPLSDIPYIGNNVYGSYYKPISKNFIMNLKAGANSINSLSNSKDVKLSDRKFLTNKSLRGFESFGVGPKDGSDHIGGNYSAYGSISSTFPNPFPDKWNAKSLIFLDAGNVWGVDFDDSKDKSKIRSSTGISLEWVSPLGPLSFTLSETLSSANGDLEESFSFEIGSTF